ncbi:hypothetical protein PVK64_03435 [Aliivibrio sp. S4TY2]|uniref:hypothetical protein n=1 Tax=unclassified Aliivibrio TaxID=2645654 RepID=UPI00237806AE|nr:MULTISPECIES: hypothetical protein [unclassified Aliivibrio]MDD9155245.1 hypothetical protein [Aliivibrio sp. S4TY2]MDD9159203.1 hypothetical protein [Aliivibrio sp. S4TY1]MDD9163247.1 hypothetical protein [Aliivibrio sp. S4MY2]MDD9167202.1 hypothetical protein [Aliivibrio sp. S4MY4]MDD9184324.1 hypothetical protein [Aliivibrio sp. S4MY3]
MNIIFVDAENIGLPSIQEIDARITDKVFVFSNNEQIKTLCHDLMFIVMDGYPVGKNQADFYLIAHLSKAISQVRYDEKKKLTFILYSNDNPLCQAFEFQCQHASIASEIVNTKPVLVQATEIQEYTAKDLNNIALLYNTLKAKSMIVTELFNTVKLEQTEATKALNALVKKELIARTPNNKKVWQVIGKLRPELFA